MKAWWHLYPGRREAELAALDRAGIAYRVDEDAERKGVLALDLDYPLETGELRLRAVFPGLYPYFRPRVEAPNVSFERHQDPFGKSLCLLGPRTQLWEPETTLAAHLTRWLPDLLADQPPVEGAEPPSGPRPVKEEEDAEVLSNYFEYADPSYVMVDGDWRVGAEIVGGTLTVAISLKVPDEENFALQGLVTKVSGARGEIARWRLPKPRDLSATVEVPFARVARPAFEASPQEQYRRLVVDHPVLGKAKWRRFGRDGEVVEVAFTAIAFDEEIRPGVAGQGWQFFMLKRPNAKTKPSIHRIRAVRVGQSDLGARVPATSILRGRTVALFGCGAVGGPIALELAKAGIGELRLFDPDIVDPGPTVRWPLGRSVYGQNKTGALVRHIAANWMHANVVGHRMVIGATPDADDKYPKEGEIQLFEKLLDGVDVIFDATAEVGVQHFLSDWARARGIPFIYASATPGACGGIVARFMPGDGQGCWRCLQHALYTDKTIAEPPFADNGEILPPGCNHPTFTGASFDLVEVSLQAVRVIVRALDDRQPRPESGYAILSFDEGFGVPSWRTGSIPRNDECSCTG
ncbi:hypothetical protein DS837_11135 [Azospirillum brasilense]|uniref:THIF-type NAD/FAD binding fold domain-containing protein n=2 Tax=Azospirillum TaxID=191 RepID=A0A6L3B1P7_AZOBR|nr:hypothetical protein DS837_11135 [Azospirillum brasilense]